MLSKLEILKKNVIFLFIGSRELYFIRFLDGKIFSTRLYKSSYNTKVDSLKSFFKDYFLGKEGIPVAIVFDIPHQSFTEYRFLKAISKIAIHHSIIKKISQDIPQEAIHDYCIVPSSDARSNENVYQVTSLIKTATVAACLDLLQKFPNPIAGYFSITLEMPTICEGNVRRVQMAKPIPILEQDAIDIREKGHDELTVSIQYSPISGINFSLSQGKKILFHHHIICSQITEDLQKEINTTSLTIIDYIRQLNLEYKVYVYGSENLLKSILKTTFDQTLTYYTQSELQNAKFFYHKDYSENLATVNTLDAIAFKCLYEPTFFIENKSFFSTILKHYARKASMFLFTFVVILIFLYQLFMSAVSAMESFTKYRNSNSLDVSNVMNKVNVLEKSIANQKQIVSFYSSFSTDVYFSLFEQIAPLVKGSAYIKGITYSCSLECYGANAIIDVEIVGNATELQDYYSLISDIRRIFYRYEITKKIDESTNDFTVQLTNKISNKK